MGFFKRLLGGFTNSQTEKYLLRVRCNRCGEIIESCINLNNDLSQDEDGGYYVRKMLIGSGHCFERLDVVLKFDSARQLQERQVSGGAFVDSAPQES